MKIAYDISVLGMARRGATLRAGIVRAVESLALELARWPGCDVSFTACASLQDLEDSIEYVRATAGFRGVPVVEPAGIHRVARHVRARVQKLPRAGSQRSNCQAQEGVAGRLALKIGRSLEWRFRSLTPTSLATMDVFHSTFFPLPQNVTGNSLIRFVTVYDLVPLIRPDLFPGAAQTSFHEALLKSIRPQDWAVCISESTKSDLCRYGKLDGSRVFVTPLAASREIFFPCDDRCRRAEVRRKYGLPDAPYVLSLNTLEPRKNIAHVLRCFAALTESERIPDLHFVLVGAHGWNYDSIFQALAEFPRASKRVKVTGYIPDADLAAVYSGAMMFVYCSLYEGFGLPPLEAMQCGVPVITSNTSSLPEVVGDAGIVVAPTDSDALCQWMLRLYHDAAIRRSLSSMGLARASTFTWERTAAKTIDAYKRARMDI